MQTNSFKRNFTCFVFYRHPVIRSHKVGQSWHVLSMLLKLLKNEKKCVIKQIWKPSISYFLSVYMKFVSCFTHQLHTSIKINMLNGPPCIYFAQSLCFKSLNPTLCLLRQFVSRQCLICSFTYLSAENMSACINIPKLTLKKFNSIQFNNPLTPHGVTQWD